MSPIKKRARIRAETENELAASDATTSTIQAAVANIIDDVEKFKGDLRSIRQLKSNMLRLRTCQRQLYAKLYEQKLALDQAAVLGEKQFRDEAARRYEKTHLESEIDQCKSYKMTGVEKLAFEEIGVESVTAEEAVATFLKNDKFRNPSEKNAILKTLQQQLEGRGFLETEVKSKQLELKTLTRQLQTKRDFLNLLPAQLHAIERASQPLVKFIAKSSSSNSFNQKMTGKERVQRLESAQSLKPPMYTLFNLLQHYTDQVDSVDVEEQSLHSKITIKVVIKKDQTPQQQIILQLPVPDYSTSLSSPNMSKRVSIFFRYYPELSLVTAASNGCASALNQDVLLDELFPGDTTVAADLMVANKLTMMQPIDSPPRTTTPTSPIHKIASGADSLQTIGTGFQWCNVLAGLHQVPNVGNETEDHQTVLIHSTRAVMNELQRRVRSNALLKYVIQCLGKNKILVPPPAVEITGENNPTVYDWKLVMFSLKGEEIVDPDRKATKTRVLNTPTNNSTGSTDCVYHVILQKGSEQIDASVQINVATYPATPPKWSFVFKQVYDDTSKDDYPLYDTRKAQLEQSINIDMLHLVKDNTSSDAEMYCEWILIHQIREIMRLWDELLEEGTTGSSSRKVRGRDHACVKD